MEFTASERGVLLKAAREAIEFYLRKRKRPPLTDREGRLGEKRGVFVTLHKQGRLRGCIGYPLPVSPLYHAVIENAVSSAFEDPRFPQVGEKELKDIDIEISVLTVPRKIENINDIRIGRDGIIVSKGGYRGLLLPQVPVEQGWNLDEYLTYGCMKAGLPGDEWKRGVGIETFQAEVFGELSHEPG